MNAQELRIGNYVADFDCEPFYFAVEQITKVTSGQYRIHYRNNSISVIVDDSHNIPLTKEWLLNFGFEYEKKDSTYDAEYLYKSGCFLYYGESKSWMVFQDFEIDDFPTRKKIASIQYVHQLQNLIFALIGEELTIKQLVNN